MKRKLIGAIVTFMILSSMLNLSSLIKPASAKDENLSPNDSLMERVSETELPSGPSTQDQPVYSEGNWLDLLNKEFSAEEKESDTESSERNECEWIMGNASRWSDFAYVNCSRTRIVVGISAEEAGSLLELERVAAKYGGRVASKVTIGGKVRAAVVDLLLASVTPFVENVNASGLASYVEPNMKVQTQLVPNDPDWELQWGPQKIEADWAWNTTLGNHEVLVAVIDTGVDYTHPDLSANYAPMGYDWVNMDADPLDDYGHGTHCAGIIAAVVDNSVGISGLAQVQVMAEKVLSDSGVGYDDWVANGIAHAADQGADIISMSLGGLWDSKLLHEALRYAQEKGVLVIAAAGNYGSSTKTYPAAYDEVIAVAATNQDDNTASFSEWGDWIELAAPGVDVYSTMPTYHVSMNDVGYSMDYSLMSGTSMACPHVAGLAALAWSRYQQKVGDWVRLWLRYTADDLGDSGFDEHYGYGRVNARKAVEEIPPRHEIIASRLKTPSYVKPGALAVINGTVLNFGESDEANITVRLLVNDTIADSTTIDYLRSGDSSTLVFTWNPGYEGMCNVTFYVLPISGEINVENNAVWSHVFVGFSVKAVVLHSVGNVDSSIILNWQRLNDEWRHFGNAMVSIDYTTLNKDDITYSDITNAEADVLIISCAFHAYLGWEFTDSEIEAITRYVQEGHGLIVTGVTLSYEAPNNNELAPLVGLDENVKWDTTTTHALSLLNKTHPLLRNIPSPFFFPYVGTTISSDYRWDENELSGGEYLALGQFQESAIVTFRGLVYISPFFETIDPNNRDHLQLIYNAITWSRYQKPAHDLVVSLEAPAVLAPDSLALLNATVANEGSSNETNVALQLMLNETIVASELIPELAGDSSYTLSHLWNPAEVSTNIFKAYAIPLPSEKSTKNNVATKTVRVRHIRGYVLFDQTHKTDPIAHCNTLVSNLVDLGFPVGAHKAGSITPAVLEKCNVFVIIQPHSYYSADEISAIQDFVLDGGSLLVAGDDWPDVHTSLTAFAGMTWHWGGRSGFTSDITPHPVTNGVGIVCFGSPGQIYAAFPTTDIIRDQYGSVLLAVSEVKLGKVIGIADENSIDDGTIGYANNLRLATNMVEWLATPRNEHDLTVSLLAPDYAQLGNFTPVTAIVRNIGLSNETSVELRLMVNSTLVCSETVPQLSIGESYSLSYFLSPDRTGSLNVTAYAPAASRENYTTNNIAAKRVYSFIYVHLKLPHQWIGNGLPRGWHGLDACWECILPFDFPYYGRLYRTIYVSSNGLVTFLRPDTSPYNSFSALAKKLAIAPAWYDWATTDPSEIYIWQNSTHIGIRWDVQVYSSDIEAEFEAILTAEGIIQFNYDHLSPFLSATVGISNGAGHMIAEGSWNLGQVNTVIFTPFELEHELEVKLDTDEVYMPNTDVTVSASVRNIGTSNETGVILVLLLEEEIVASTLISQLDTGASHAITYEWRPVETGIYNVTTYVTSVHEETFLANNEATTMVTVSWPLIDPVEGQYANYALQIFSIRTGEVITARSINVNYAHYITPTQINITLWTKDNYGSESTFWMVVNTLNRKVEAGPEAGFWYHLWIEKDLAVGSKVNLQYREETVFGSRLVQVGTRQLDCWLIRTEYGSFSYDKSSGLFINEDLSASPTFAVRLTLLDTNVPISFEHDLSISMKAATRLPLHVSTPVEATIYNTGLRNETDVRVEILIDGALASSALVPELKVGDHYTISYEWNPLTEGTYSIMALATPLPEEIYTLNNLAQKTTTVIKTDGPCVFLNPLESTLITSRKLLVNITIASVVDLYSWQVKLYYDEAFLSFTKAWLPPDHVFAGKSYNEARPTVDQDRFGTYLLYAVTLQGVQTGIDGGGTLFQLEFETWPLGVTFLDIDTSGLGIFTTELLDSTLDEIAFIDLDGIVEIVEFEPALHDVAVTNVAPSATVIVVGQPVNVRVTVENYGDVSETFRITVYCDNTAIADFTVVDLPSCGSRNIVISWNTAGVFAGNYTLSARAWAVAGETNVANNICVDGKVTVKDIPRDVAVLSVQPSAQWVYCGRSVMINVTVANNGEVSEVFNVTVYFNFTAKALIGSAINVSLDSLQATTLSFKWNTTGVPCGCEYVITAVASLVPTETNVSDNVMSCPMKFGIRLVGDTNGDDKVDIEDLAAVTGAFGALPGQPRWNPDADVNGDGKITVLDVAMVSRNFGKTLP